MARGFQTGQIVWDDLRQVLVMQYSEMNTAGHPSGTVLELKSRELGSSVCANCMALANSLWAAN